jgi:hypothetical protein|tara:strand:- start:1503 stop:1886 length:384 start_codon:yes stop_codon:yes gene_type:complete
MVKKKYPEKYVPKSLSPEDRKKQIKSIESKTIKDRPKVKYPYKRSSHVVKFEKKYGKKITNDSFISKNIISKTGIDKILSKGRGAYKNNASRPNTTMEQWARARLASVIMNGPARKVDKSIWDKYKK